MNRIILAIALASSVSVDVLADCDTTGPDCFTSCIDPAGFYQLCNTCNSYAQCEEGIMYVMQCPPGLEWDNNIKSCIFGKSTSCNCKDSPTCDDGYTLDDDDVCVDIDECDADPCTPVAVVRCINIPGSFICVCNAGYTKNTTIDHHCDDVDECARETDDCGANADCINVPGSFQCNCSIGYEGDGYVCVDIDECTVGSDNCNENAECTNTPGSFVCMCNGGYMGDGVTCDDINECENNPCLNRGTCENAVGGYGCSCSVGFMGENCATSGYDCGNNSPCTEDNREDGNYYFEHGNKRMFVQCDEHGGCWEMHCAPGTTYKKSISVCG